MIPLLLSVALASGVYLTYSGVAHPRQKLVAPERLRFSSGPAILL